MSAMTWPPSACREMFLEREGLADQVLSGLYDDHAVGRQTLSATTRSPNDVS